MRIDRKAIAHLEALARIELTPEEVDRLAEQLNRIVEYVEKLGELNTDDIEPTGFVVHERESKLRADDTEAGIAGEEVLGQAPDAADGFFRVPRIIGREEE